MSYDQGMGKRTNNDEHSMMATPPVSLLFLESERHTAIGKQSIGRTARGLTCTIWLLEKRKRKPEKKNRFCLIPLGTDWS